MRRLIIGLIVLVGLFLAADYGSAALAESAVSRQMREQMGLADDPSVRINGFPFLTQALSGRYSTVDIEATRIKLGELRELGVRAQLREVSAPLPMLLGSGPKTLTVRQAEGTVRVPAADVERLLPGIEDLRIDPIDERGLDQAVQDGAPESLTRIDADNAARIVGTGTVLGQKEEISVIALLELDGGQARIVPQDVRIGGSDSPPLPAPIQRTLQQAFSLRIDPGSLPLAVTPTRLRAQGGALEISGVAQDLTLGAGTLSTTS